MFNIILNNAGISPLHFKSEADILEFPVRIFKWTFKSYFQLGKLELSQ